MADRVNDARRHHWVPQCYLKGFTKDRNKTSHLYVVDGFEKKSFLAPPSKVAVERDFNRVDIEGQHHNAVESAFSEFETLVSDALYRIDAEVNFSNENDRVLVLNLIALLAVRNPRMREMMRSAKERQSEVIMDLLLSSKERWSSALQKAGQAGFVNTDSKVTFGEMRDFVDRGEYDIEVPTTEHVINELELFDEILPCLVARKWTLITANSSSGGFITCDHPVVLKWDGTQKREPRSPPGFALLGTEVVFPLSRRLALSGMFNGEELTGMGTTELVVAINGMTIANASRQVYASDANFGYFINAEQGARVGSDLVKDLIALETTDSE